MSSLTRKIRRGSIIQEYIPTLGQLVYKRRTKGGNQVKGKSQRKRPSGKYIILDVKQIVE